MVGNVLITVGLVLDILGVALLLAGPRVHPRQGGYLRLEGNMDRLEGDTKLRRTWSQLGWLGLPTVATGFTLQILGVWADELELLWLCALIGLVIPPEFAVFGWVARQFPHGD